MQYLVAGRLYQDYQKARQYADLIHKISRIIVAVEAVTDDFQEQMLNLLDTVKHPPASPD